MSLHRRRQSKHRRLAWALTPPTTTTDEETLWRSFVRRQWFRCAPYPAPVYIPRAALLLYKCHQCAHKWRTQLCVRSGWLARWRRRERAAKLWVTLPVYNFICCEIWITLTMRARVRRCGWVRGTSRARFLLHIPPGHSPRTDDWSFTHTRAHTRTHTVSIIKLYVWLRVCARVSVS